eukprot:91680_1
MTQYDEMLLHELICSAIKYRLCYKCAILLLIYSDKLNTFIKLIDYIFQYSQFAITRINFYRNPFKRRRMQTLIELFSALTCYPQIRYILMRQPKIFLQRVSKFWQFAIEYCQTLAFHAWQLNEKTIQRWRYDGAMVLLYFAGNMKLCIQKLSCKNIRKLIKTGHFKWMINNKNLFVTCLNKLFACGHEFEAQLLHASYSPITVLWYHKTQRVLTSNCHRLKQRYVFAMHEIVNEFRIPNKHIVSDEIEGMQEQVRIAKASWIHCNCKKCKTKCLISSKDKIKQLKDLAFEELFQHNGNRNGKFKLCGGCNLVYYCSRKCQKYDWNKGNHKALCLSFRRFMSVV